MIKKTKKVKKDLCPYCKKDLVKVGIGFSQAGVMTYRVSSDGERLEYDTNEFGDQDGGEFYCQDCGMTLPLDEDEVIKIMYKYDNR